MSILIGIQYAKVVIRSFIKRDDTVLSIGNVFCVRQIRILKMGRIIGIVMMTVLSAVISVRVVRG